MIEIQCPFCEAACRVDAAAFKGEVCIFRCDGCSVETEIDGASSGAAIPLAA